MHISKGGGFFTGTWTVKDCIPVNDEYVSTYFSASTLYVANHGVLVCENLCPPPPPTHSFYNVEGGFNPDDFDPPSFCQ